MRIRPAGNRINLTTGKFNRDSFSPFKVNFYQSGTSALAAAVMASIRLKNPEGCKQPEILVPAYACPDLVSAIIYAGAKPVLVDLEPELPWMSIEELKHKINKNTAAVIAVNFLGIRERIDQIASLCREQHITLIEDSAQGFPKSNPEFYWKSDFIIISFGRGKPVNLLSGGAVLSKNAELNKLLPIPETISNNLADLIKYGVKANIYNISIKPFVYGLICRIPGLHIGKTIYKPLHEVSGIQSHILEHLSSNLDTYRTAPNIAEKLQIILSKYKNTLIEDLVSTTHHDLTNPLLRYPFLVKKNVSRDLVYNRLSTYGASIMYQKPLNKIAGVTALVETNHNPNSTDFADRLITLPTHNDVDDSVLESIDKNLSILARDINENRI